MLGPVAAVDHADDDILAGTRIAHAAADAAELGPQSALVGRFGETEEAGRVCRVEREQLGLLDAQHTLGALELLRLNLRQRCGETVDRMGVVVDRLAAADLVEERLLLVRQVLGVALGCVALRVVLLTLGWLRPLVAPATLPL